MAHAARRLVEPFCGGLAVTFGLLPDRALLNDANPHLVNFYRWLARGLVIDITMENDERLFYCQRARFNALLRAGRGSGAEAAGLFYYLNRTGYNGLCRFNQAGEFNVPFGQYRRIGYLRDFSAYRTVFAGWSFMTGDFESVPLGPDDFVYADPPYDVPFTHYARGGFSSGADGRVARAALRPGRAGEPGHAAYHGPLPDARVRTPVPGRTAAHQLHGRSHAGP
jgi:DNA adenine methylase